MTAAATLIEAAGLTWANLLPLWKADTLKAKVVAFAAAADPILPEQTTNNRPLGDWIANISALAQNILIFNQDPTSSGVSVGVGSITTYRMSVDYIYRMFKLAAALQSAGLISSAQATALLAAYNAQFA